jgi:hypothetical protein
LFCEKENFGNSVNAAQHNYLHNIVLYKGERR